MASVAPPTPVSSSAAAMTVSDWFARLQRDGAAEAMARVGVEEAADLLEVEPSEIDEIAEALPSLKARQFKRFIEMAVASAA